ncbi:MAG: methylmalonyl-CoA mutase small subunit, partial [Prevotellaceae bacterium]|nr:methylmalonyl-CoA mutase small subunit [Prevotellaceae bacterium]
PFYREENIAGVKTNELFPGEFPYVQGADKSNEWFIRQNIIVENAKEANKKALDVLNKGITSLAFRLNKKDLSPEYIAALLDGIAAGCVELNFRICVRRAADLAVILTDYYKSKKYDLSKLQGSINLDPVNRMLLEGKKLTKDFVAERLVETTKALAELPNYRAITVNGVTLSNAGAYCVQELGYTLAWGNEYLSMLVDSGIDAATAAKNIRFTFGAGGNYFMEIAKFRAARWLWALIVNEYTKDKDAAKMVVHAETTWFNMTIFDANVNMLRTQTEAMSATLGGVDSLTVLPYDCAYKPSDEFSERIARNQQLLLKEECHFDKVADPAAGSYYIETLTNEIAAKAWEIFLATEEKGFFTEIEAGNIQKTVKATAAVRFKAVSSRKEILLGTNQFPNFTETALSKVERWDETSCSSCNDGAETLPPVREAAEFETLRFAVEKAAKRPKAFMLTIGNLAMRLARAQFSCNFFACAGYEVIDNLGFKTVEEGVEAARKAGADIIVLCSSDDEYAELAPAAYKLAKGKEVFVVAGAPACADDLKAIGIEYFITVRTNVLESLKGFNEKLI